MKIYIDRANFHRSGSITYQRNKLILTKKKSENCWTQKKLNGFVLLLSGSIIIMSHAHKSNWTTWITTAENWQKPTAVIYLHWPNRYLYLTRLELLRIFHVLFALFNDSASGWHCVTIIWRHGKKWRIWIEWINWDIARKLLKTCLNYFVFSLLDQVKLRVTSRS